MACFGLAITTQTAHAGDEAQEKKNYHKTMMDLLYANDLASRDKSFLFLFVHPSYQVFDYTNKNDFQRSILIEDGFFGVDINSVGHIQFGWYCQARNDVYSGAAGYTGEQDDQFKTMVENGWGLTPLLADFTDGEFEPEDWVVEDLQTMWNNEEGYFWMAVEVSKDQCFNSIFFLEDFIQKAPSIFSFTRDPMKYEGGVCSSVAASFFRHASSEYQDLIDATFRSVRMSRQVLGHRPSKGLPEDVALPEFLQGRAEQNVERTSLIFGDMPFNPTENFEKFEFYDPELMAFMIKTLEDEYVPGKSKMMTRKIIDLKERHHFSRDDFGHRQRRYTTRYREVSKNTDQNYRNVYNAVKAFKRNFPKAKVERKMLQGQAGIVITRD